MIQDNDLVKAYTQFHHFKPDAAEIYVRKEQIETVLGYNHKDIPEEVQFTINESLEEYKNYIEPQGAFGIYALDSLSKEIIRFGSTDFITGPIISSQIKKCTFIAVFISTIGKNLETLSGTLLKQGDYLKGYILDAIASEAVEVVCNLLELKIIDFLSGQKYGTTNRYSPGYCNWHVSEQKKLFALIPEGLCGISLTESSLMLPVKSVSGIIGIGVNAKKTEYSCSFCGLENCYKKKDHT